MATIVQRQCESENGLAWIEVRFDDTNDLVNRIRWQNGTNSDRVFKVRDNVTGADVITGIVPANSQIFTVSFSGGNRPLLSSYSVSC